MRSGTRKTRFLCFVRQFLEHPKQLGTFTQSSRALARRMAQEIDGSLEVVEFGAGTGVVTEEILRKLPENGRLVCFEINPRFCDYLRGLNDPRLKVINDDARNCEQYVDDLKCVVSGLPLMLFSGRQRNELLATVSKADRYIQLQYFPVLKGRLKDRFPQVKLRFVPQNLPPAFVCVCSRPARTQ